ncbi:MAG: deoxyhypusine synthase family protein, partial [candidate division Zixibacteria bacterium]|nr:deoxyhypusine synthase family protein [candidate division Zixibacteria bacterium]
MMKHDEQDRTQRHLKLALAAKPIDGATPFVDLIDSGMSSFNARQLSLACRLLARQLAAGDTRIGLSLSGALIPAGFGRSCLVPLIRSGFIDWVVSTGANLYHDLQMALGFEMFAGSPHADDTALRDDGVIRIYDLYFKSEALYTTDAFIRDLFRRFFSEGKIGGKVSSSVVHEALGRELLRLDPRSGEFSVLAAAAEMGVPLHTSSPGDSGIGLNLAALYLDGVDMCVEPSIDVNETAAYVYQAKRTGGKSAVVILGGGSPK